MYSEKFAARSTVAPVSNTEPRVDLIFWNRRSEYAKNPDEFFEILFEFSDSDCDFRQVVLGQDFTALARVRDTRTNPSEY